MARDQSSHVMWELLVVGLEIRVGSRKAGQEITGQGRSQGQPEAFLVRCPRKGCDVPEGVGSARNC